MGESTLGGVQVLDLLEALRVLGADPAELCHRAGVSQAGLQDPTVRVPSTRFVALFDAAERRLRDPVVGLHAGASVEPRGLLSYLLMASGRLGDGIDRFMHFVAVAIDGARYDLIRRSDTACFIVDLNDPRLGERHHTIDYLLGNHLKGVRRAFPDFQLLEVHLRHAEQGERGETARIFGCPVHFRHRQNALVFPAQQLEAVPRFANPAVAEQLEKFAAAQLTGLRSAERFPDRVADAVRAHLARGLRADAAMLAERLHVSERTLQRRLGEEGTTFKAVRDGVLLEVAQALLSNPTFKIQAVALSLGFAEAAAFSKAFRRWAGCSPARYRARLVAPQRRSTARSASAP